MLEKPHDPIPRKLTDRQKDGRKDGQRLFYRTLPAEVGGPKSGAQVIQKLSSNVVCSSDDENRFLRKLLLRYTQI